MAGITCPVRVEQERESSQSQRELEPESESCQGLWDPGVAEKGDNSRAEDVCEESLVDVYQFRPPFISVSLSFSMIIIIYLWWVLCTVINAFFCCCCTSCTRLSESFSNLRSTSSRRSWAELSKQKSPNEEPETDDLAFDDRSAHQRVRRARLGPQVWLEAAKIGGAHGVRNMQDLRRQFHEFRIVSRDQVIVVG